MPIPLEHVAPGQASRLRRWLAMVGLALVLGCGAPVLVSFPFGWNGAAHADDGDDGGGAGGSGAGGYGGSYGRGTGGSFNPLRAVRRLIPNFGGNRRDRQAEPRAPRPVRAPGEIVATGLGPDGIARLADQGYALVVQDALPALGVTLAKLRVPDGTTLEAAREAVRAAGPSVVADYNHFYRTEQDDPAPDRQPEPCAEPHCRAPGMIGWPGRIRSCRQDVLIGLIDTAINADHAAFLSSRLEVQRLDAAASLESDPRHGTAVAALLVGDPGSRTPGLVPGARLLAIDAFRPNGQDSRAELFDLVRAMDRMAGREVAVLNMSLSGPANALLERSVGDVIARGTVLVAAVGNGGPQAETAYPAGYADVIAVTAVDRRKRIYRRAIRGGHVDLAAPGVNVWAAASIKGARPRTGTSFAAPFVTAAVALARAADPEASPGEIGALLARDAEDLGENGRDDVFGDGLIRAERYCEHTDAPRALPVAGEP